MIDHPWILECHYKAKLLEIESKLEMNSEMKKALGQDNLLMMLLQPQHLLYFVLEVRRESLIKDTLDQLHKSKVNFKRPMKIKFRNEQGVDEGGVKKEFFQLVTRELFDATYGMFIPKNVTSFRMNSIDRTINSGGSIRIHSTVPWLLNWLEWSWA